jgi:pyruvate formate-lyase activating enzyme-like uncharacterized protein
MSRQGERTGIKVMWDEAPGFLKAISEEARFFREQAHTPSDLESGWRAYMQEARRCISGLKIDAGKATVCLGELSMGCQACKEGTWDCIFLTQRCNLSCSFCYSPTSMPGDAPSSAFGETLEEITANYTRTRIQGISFSGGEPFLEPERLLKWVSFFRSRFPEAYLWIYTNGILVEERALQTLGAVGLNEIRFNTAASGYDDSCVLETMQKAAGIFPNLTVEIPAIPEQAQKLRDSLALWAGLGVRYLNLHELLYETGTNSAKLPGPRQSICLADGHLTAVHPGSRDLILEIMEKVQVEGLSLAVNHCSLPNKINQVRGRRLSLLPMTKKPYEKLVAGERLESYCLVDGQGHVSHLHPDELPALWKRSPLDHYMRLVRTAPLGVRDPGRWVACEEISRDA